MRHDLRWKCYTMKTGEVYAMETKSALVPYTYCTTMPNEIFWHASIVRTYFSIHDEDDEPATIVNSILIFITR